MTTKRAAKTTPHIGPKGRPLSTIRLVLDAKTPETALGFLGKLTPVQRERVTDLTIQANSFRAVLETPSSETRDIDEAIRALPGGLQAMVVHASKLSA